MIHVVATITCKPGQMENFLAEFRKIIPLVHREKGCVDYVPTVDAASNSAMQSPCRPDTITIVERWATLPDLEAHLVAPHMVEYRPKVKPFIESITLQVLQDI